MMDPGWRAEAEEGVMLGSGGAGECAIVDGWVVGGYTMRGQGRTGISSGSDQRPLQLPLPLRLCPSRRTRRVFHQTRI